MKRTSAFLLGLALFLGVGCADETEDDDSSDTSPPGDDDNDDDEATATPAGDDDATEPDSGQISPTPTPTPIPNPLTTVDVWPSYMQIDTTSSFSYHAKGRLKSGEEVDVSIDEWTSTDEAVATIDATGVVTAHSAGTAFITAVVDGVSSSQVQLDVIDPGSLKVRVIDADTRQPLADADVFLGMDGTVALKTDSVGEATFTGEFSGVQTVTGHVANYHYATVAGAVSRIIDIPLRSVTSTTQGSFSGDVDFSGMGEVGLKEIRVGLITRSFYGNSLALDTSTIIGKNRKVEVCGAETYLPTNIVGEVSACETDPQLLHYVVPGPSGEYDSYLLAGDLNLQEVLEWLTDPDIFTNLGKLLLTIDNMYEFSYYYGHDITIVAPGDAPGYDVAPDGLTNEPLTVQVPTLPNGISAEYPPVVFAIADIGEHGLLPVGLAGAEPGTKVPVFHPPMTGDLEGKPLTALIMACDQGVGHDGAYVAVTGEETGTVEPIKTPPFMDLIQRESYDVTTRSFSFFPVPDTTVYRSIFSWQLKEGDVRKDVIWDVYQPATMTTVTLPVVTGAPAVDEVDWEFYAYDNGERYPFEVFTGGKDLNAYDSSIYLERISRNKNYNLPE